MYLYIDYVCGCMHVCVYTSVHVRVYDYVGMLVCVLVCVHACICLSIYMLPMKFSVFKICPVNFRHNNVCFFVTGWPTIK